ncbi:MAG: iron hydrogenase small subunit [Bacilli bacterium]|nr:iron hydrogenase small subunit [Bacilli bacterium]
MRNYDLEVLISENIDITKLEDSNFDSPLGTGSTSGLIFGTTGGVCEAILRTAYYYMNGENLSKDNLIFKDIRGMNGIKESKVKTKDREIKVAVCNGIKNAKKLIDKLIKKEVHYDLIEVMNCIGRCIAGGGQPKTSLLESSKIKKIRMDSLYKEDEKKTLRLCHGNKEIIDIYDNYLIKPNSEIALNLLHTHYEDKSKMLGGDI